MPKVKSKNQVDRDKLKKLYLFPVKANKNEGNPYMNELCKALEANYRVVNADDPPQNGILNIFRYLRTIDLVYLNWIEELPIRYMGVLQSFIFIVVLHYLKITRRKVVWTLHNKKSHWGKHPRVSNILFRQMIRKSDLIITHAEEGLYLVKDRSRIEFLHHPIRPISEVDPSEGIPDSDIMIWGTIAPYKGIDTFLQFLDERSVLNRYRILIAGKITPDDLESRFREFESRSDNLILINEYLPDPRIKACIKRSKLVLFTYHSDSVLSSGALMDSLCQSTLVIGPDTGAFRDLYELGLIEVFSDFPELLKKIDLHLESNGDLGTRREKIIRFISENSWEKYSEKLGRIMLQHLSDPGNRPV